MTVAAFIFAAVLAPQEPATTTTTTTTTAPAEAAPAGAAQEYIDAGLKAFRRRRFSAAQADFQKAVDANPQSAAATFYLGYTYYKIAEPTRRLTPGKKRAAELFAKAYELDPAFRPVWGQKG